MKKSFPFFIFLTLLLGSCSLDISIGSSNKGTTSATNTPDNSSVVSPTTGDGSTNTGGANTSATPSTSNGAQVLKNNGYTNTLRDSNEQLGWNTLNSTGDQKVLVVPVHFQNATKWSTSMLSDLELVFFGESKYTAWESVSSYFNKSSYGNLNLTGEVYDTVLEVDMTASTYNTKYNNWYNYVYYGEYTSDTTNYDPGEYIGSLFYNSLNSSGMKKLQEYDQDKDGYIDAIIFCYSNAFASDGSGAYWAWCSYTDNKANLQGPTVNNYMWLSYEFIHEGYGNNAIDGHTFIHEMGHILGLDDYYCYDYYEKGYGNYPWNCAGELDMQSYNVGDHNIYSKFSLGWLEPKWIKESGEVKLRPSNQYGDAILLKDSWNGTIFDEYILIEFYTPEGLNEKDATSQYSGRDKMYSQSGLRIYHVDARIANLTSKGAFKNFAVTAENIVSIFNSNSNYGYVAASNSVERSYLSSNQEKDRLLHLIDAGGNNTIAKGLSNRDNNGGTYANRNSTIWQEGKTFTATSAFFMNGANTFNDGSKVGYSVTVGAIENGEITVNIQKL